MSVKMTTSEIERMIEEDVNYFDVSAEAVPDVEVTASITSMGSGILAGAEEAAEILKYFNLKVELRKNDGERLHKGDAVMAVTGSSRSILTAERTALNVMGRMSGVATVTGEFVDAVKGAVKVAGTRKNTPGFRKYEKKAIMIGGGAPHRFNLSDGILIKDNHIRIGGLEQCIEACRRTAFTKRIEVEVETVDEAVRAAECGAEIIMLDNMAPEEIVECISVLDSKGLRKGITLEASGGITLDNVEDYSKTGVDVISSGALTNSGRCFNFSLEIIKVAGDS